MFRAKVKARRRLCLQQKAFSALAAGTAVVRAVRCPGFLGLCSVALVDVVFVVVVVVIAVVVSRNCHMNLLLRVLLLRVQCLGYS